MMLTGARAFFSAAHKLPEHPALHGHSYEVWAYTNAHVDAEEWQLKLATVTYELHHTTLPPELSRMEEIAQWIGARLEAVKVEVIRPVEGMRAEWRAK